jgi:hypothetical protein
MEFEAGNYQKLVVKQFPARSIRETAEGKYWKQFKAPVFAKQVNLGPGCRPPCCCCLVPTWFRRFMADNTNLTTSASRDQPK